MPHFKAFGTINLQYEIRICHKIHIKCTMSQWQVQVTIFLSGTDVKSMNYWLNHTLARMTLWPETLWPGHFGQNDTLARVTFWPVTLWPE